MKRLLVLSTFLITNFAISQTVLDSTKTDQQVNSSQRMMSKVDKKLTIGGYGEITYNQPETQNGELDVQRLVMMFGYKFNDKVQFFTEIEYEHVKEVFVEQAFVNYAVGDNISVRGGLMLVPMGIVNEYHEPTTFNGVERPAVDNKIVPTTWREIGVGVSGKYNEASLRYQAYIFNGFQTTTSDGNGNITGGELGGSKGLRGGRQKGAKSNFNNVNVAAKLDYYGMPGLRLGLSGYFGRTQSNVDVANVDGSDIGMSMFGFDARYAYQRFTARGQYIYASITDTEAYNTVTGKDLGSALQGYYLEAAYNLLSQEKEQQLIGFVRYEDYNTHSATAGTLGKNGAYDRQEWTLGLSFKIAPGAVVKTDYQFKNNALDNSTKQLNFGIGVWF